MRSAEFGRICNQSYFRRVNFSGNAQKLPARPLSGCALATSYDWQPNCFSLVQTKWRATGHYGKYFGQRSFRVPLCNSKFLLCWTGFVRRGCWALRSVFWQPSPEVLHDPTDGDRAECWFLPATPKVNCIFALAAVHLALTITPQLSDPEYQYRLGGGV